MSNLTVERPPSTKDDFVLNGLDEDAVASLRSLLTSEGYLQRYLALTRGSLFVRDYGAALRDLGRIGGREAALLELLALGREVEDELLAPWAVTCGLLEDCGLLQRDGSSLSTCGWVVAPMLGTLLLTGIPSTYPMTRAIGAPGYVGNDSLLLAASLPDTRGRSFLDLGAGNGVQGIAAAHGASEAVLTDVDPFGLWLSAFNVALARPDHPVRIVCGDTFAPVQDERFDLIVALPPYVPTVADSRLSEIVAGGTDGLGFIRRLLRQTADHLAPGGSFYGLAQLLCDDDGPLLARELAELTPGLSSQMSSFDWVPLQPYLVSLAANLTAHGSTVGGAELVARYSAALRARGITAVCTTLFTLTADGPGTTRRHSGPARSSAERIVPMPTGTVGLAANASDRHLVRGVEDLGMVPGPTAALLAVADGRRTIAECADAAWGVHADAERRDLLDQAIARFLELERLGALVLGESDRA